MGASYFNKGPVRDPEHLKYIRTLPCCVPGCRRGPIHAHHSGLDKGMGQKPSDSSAAPVCERHHRALHDKGRAWFENYYRLDLVDIANRLWADRKKEGAAA